MTVEAVVFDICTVRHKWYPEQFYDRKIGADRRKHLFSENDPRFVSRRPEVMKPDLEIYEIVETERKIVPERCFSRMTVTTIPSSEIQEVGEPICVKGRKAGRTG